MSLEKRAAYRSVLFDDKDSDDDGVDASDVNDDDGFDENSDEDGWHRLLSDESEETSRLQVCVVLLLGF